MTLKMKYLFVILVMFFVTNIYSQTLEERAAIRACECILNAEDLSNKTYKKCLISSLSETITKDENPSDLKLMSTESGVKNTLKKTDSIVSRNYAAYREEKLYKLKEKFYSDSKKTQVKSSFIMGNNLMHEMKYDAAIESYEIALRYDSLFVPAIDNIAVCYKKKGDFEHAIRYYQRSLRIYPEGNFALMNIGVIYAQKSEFQTSNTYYKKLLHLYPKNAEGYFGLGKNLVFLNEFETALENIVAAQKIYRQESSKYITDTEKIIELIYQKMKKINKEEDFNKIARKLGIEIK